MVTASAPLIVAETRLTKDSTQQLSCILSTANNKRLPQNCTLHKPSDRKENGAFIQGDYPDCTMAVDVSEERLKGDNHMQDVWIRAVKFRQNTKTTDGDITGGLW